MGLALLIVMSMAVAGFGRTALQQVGGQMLELTEQQMAIVSLLSKIKDNVSVTARAARNIALLNNEQAKQAEKQQIDANRSDTQALLKQIEEHLGAHSGGALLERVTQTRLAYVKVLN